MISFKMVKRYCKDDISLIENYDKAISDKDNIWDCHHRREIETPRKELIELGEYYNRPASELIFLTKSEHMSLHNKGIIPSEETKKKMSEANRNRSEETRRKLSIASKGNKYMLGKHHSEESRKKISEALKGKRQGRCWYNNGIKNVFARECPEGFVKGFLTKRKRREHNVLCASLIANLII